MSKSKTPKKKKIITTKQGSANSKTITKRKLAPTSSRSKSSAGTVSKNAGGFIFNKENYKWMGIGVGLILLGLVLMIGGHMPDANTWDPSRIYSFRITVLAPFLILVGLVMQIYAIFK